MRDAAMCSVKCTFNRNYPTILYTRDIQTTSKLR